MVTFHSIHLREPDYGDSLLNARNPQPLDRAEGRLPALLRSDL